jgi:RHS repeat-associated protein
MLDDVGLIHMNGRLYDPFLGRFCAADPYVQSPKNTQNYNRYTYVLNNPLSLVDPSGHFFGLIFGAIAAVATWIAGAVGAIIVAIGVILHAIGSLIIAAGKLLWAAVKFTLTAVKASAAWMKTVGTKLITSIKAGVGPALKWMATNQIAAGAATNAAWSGIQTARHGGSASDIWKSVARGAVIGAVSAVIGMGMHKMGTALGSIAQGGNSVTGTLVHAAAHGVSGGAMTAANGGSFKDGFIGGAIGFGVGLPFGGAGGMIQGTDLGSIAARTTIAAIGGGVASRLSGGSFADGAYSAAFFHLFNNELKAKQLYVRDDGRLSTPSKRHNTVVLYDGADVGGPPFRDPDSGLMTEMTTGAGFADFAKYIVGHNAFAAVDISENDWLTKYQDAVATLTDSGGVHRLIIADHGGPAKMFFGDHKLDPRGSTWTQITRVLPSSRVRIDLLGCMVGRGSRGSNYLSELSQYSAHQGIRIGAFNGSFSAPARRGNGPWVSKQFE